MFRFTIRDVLWLTVVVALGVGWWLDHASSRSQAVERDNEWLKCFLQGLKHTGEPYTITTPDGQTFKGVESSPTPATLNRP